MIIDEKGRLFSKISIVDIAVLVFVICAAAFIVMKFFAPAGNLAGAEQVNCEYIVKVQNVRQASVDAIEKSVGMNVTDSTGVFLGTLKKIDSVKPYQSIVTKPNGSMVLADMPEKFELLASIEVSGTKTTDSIMVSNKRELSVGSHLSITTPEITVEVVVTKIGVK